MSKPEEKTAAASATTTVEKVTRDISTSVLKKVEAFQAAGELTLPPGYSAENALKSAYLILADTKNSAGDCALDYCTKESIANSLLKMVVWGLSPMKIVKHLQKIENLASKTRWLGYPLSLRSV